MSDEIRLMTRLAVGGYLVYLAYRILSAQLGGGDTGMSDPAAWASGCVLGLSGLAFCIWALKRPRGRRTEEDESAGEETK